MKFGLWHFVIAAILVIVAAWAIIRIITASISFLWGISGSLIVLAIIVALCWYGYTRLFARGT